MYPICSGVSVRHGPYREDRKVHHRPLPAVLAYQRHTVAALDSPPLQQRHRCPDPPVHLLRADRLPLTVIAPLRNGGIATMAHPHKHVIDRLKIKHPKTLLSAFAAAFAVRKTRSHLTRL
jgi:hypothetical protein